MEKLQDEGSSKRKLGLFDAVMLVMGSMIGSGIFIVSADIMRNLGSGYWLIVVWVITGVMTVAAAIGCVVDEKHLMK